MPAKAASLAKQAMPAKEALSSRVAEGLRGTSRAMPSLASDQCVETLVRSFAALRGLRMTSEETRVP